MAQFEIVAHRGAPEGMPENTPAAFLNAIRLGADAVELDVRLTANRVPVVFHYFYLDEFTTLSGPLFQRTWSELCEANFVKPVSRVPLPVRIASLDEVLQLLQNRIGLEMEIKGPEPISVETVAAVIKNHPQTLEKLEITSYEPLLLERIRAHLPGIPTDLLIPLNEPWMKADVLAYTALERGRLAGARTVHLHASQLLAESVNFIRQGGCEVHAWGINDQQALETASGLGIERICTDALRSAVVYRQKIKRSGKENETIL